MMLALLMQKTNLPMPLVRFVWCLGMGGVMINEKAEIVKEGGKSVIGGLYAGGEVAGGVHGKNRLGGSGLLGAVVYGRVAGASACKYLMEQLSTQKAEKRLGAVMGQLFSSFTLQAKPEGLHITLGYAGSEDSQQSHSGASSTSSSSSASAAKPSSSSASTLGQTKQQKPAAKEKPPQKEYTMDEIAKHNTEQDCWVVVNGQVLNATPFLNKHPGGKEAILLYAGKDATEEFNMLHKPDVVEKYAPDIIIGTYKK